MKRRPSKQILSFSWFIFLHFFCASNCAKRWGRAGPHTEYVCVCVCERDQVQLCLVLISATQRKLGDEGGTEIKPRKRRRAEENKYKLTARMAVVSHSAGIKGKQWFIMELWTPFWQRIFLIWRSALIRLGLMLHRKHRQAFTHSFRGW